MYNVEISMGSTYKKCRNQSSQNSWKDQQHDMARQRSWFNL